MSGRASPMPRSSRSVAIAAGSVGAAYVGGVVVAQAHSSSGRAKKRIALVSWNVRQCGKPRKTTAADIQIRRPPRPSTMDLAVTDSPPAPRAPQRALVLLKKLLPTTASAAVPFATLVATHQGMVRGFLRRLCNADAIADDLAQETFLKAKKALPGFRGEGSMASWLLRIAYREFLSHKRKRNDDLVDNFDDVDNGALRLDRTLEHDVRRALRALSDDERVCVAACFFDDLTHEEAAVALELPLGTLKTHIARAKEKLRAPLSAYETKLTTTMPTDGGAR